MSAKSLCAIIWTESLLSLKNKLHTMIADASYSYPARLVTVNQTKFLKDLNLLKIALLGFLQWSMV